MEYLLEVNFLKKFGSVHVAQPDLLHELCSVVPLEHRDDPLIVGLDDAGRVRWHVHDRDLSLHRLENVSGRVCVTVVQQKYSVHMEAWRYRRYLLMAGTNVLSNHS